MSLDFNLTRIKNYKELCWSDINPFTGEKEEDGARVHLHYVTHQIVWGCLPTGIGELTDKTIPEWYARYTIWAKLKNIKNPVTLEQLWEHKGLSTNVFPQESRTAWLKRIIQSDMDDLKISAERYNDKKKEATVV